MSGHVIKRNVGSCSPQGRRFGHISVVAMFHFVVNVFGEYLKQQIEDLQEANKEKDSVHATEIKKLKLDNAVDSALTAAKAKIGRAHV